ncbi:50S ribosomal protein L19 [Mycoplasma elephantis]|uniref:50S ribosomal protein L19 n=1 Tax=Mycoplasma elephantis TaxID=114882 RepID=UPI0004859D20|nr:50S ribosomal protein L19 [Mycoplasma elephantis]
MRNKLLEVVEASQLRNDLPEFSTGENVKVYVRIKEGDKERIQIFEGLVISKKESGTREHFTVRKISDSGVGIERTFALHSTLISKIEVTRKNKVRRKRLWFMRDRAGKKARLKEIRRK